MTDALTHTHVYEQALYYDIAFSYRDYAEECDFILQTAGREGLSPRSVLELAAGPARHALCFAERGLRAHALDLSPAMMSYSKHLADQAGVELDYRLGDMRDFKQSPRVDLVITMIDSASYLLSRQDFESHLEAISEALNPGGIYLIEMGHPRDFFSPQRSSTVSQWEMERDGITVNLQWGTDDNPIDPLTQVSRIQVNLRAETAEQRFDFHEEALQRVYTWQELLGLFDHSPLQLCASYGAFDLNCPIDARDAWRAIAVLKRN